MYVMAVALRFRWFSVCWLRHFIRSFVRSLSTTTGDQVL